MPHDDPTGGGYQVVVAESRDDALRDEESRLQQEREEFLSLAQDRFKTIVDAESVLRQHMLEDLQFRASEQWPDNVKSMREQDNRPCLTVNRLPSFIRQITNNQRISRPAIEISPTGDIANEDVAEVLQGVVRHIETKSDADVAYTTAGDHQCTMGRGYLRVVTDYIDQSSFSMDQEIKIARVPNPFAVYMDPNCQEADCSDARYAFIVEDIPRSEYEFRYPDSEMASLSEFTSTGNNEQEWMPEGNIRIAEYFYVEEVKVMMVLLILPDGSERRETKASIDDGAVEIPEGVVISAEREITTRNVRWALINAIEVLEGDEEKTGGQIWPGRYIPLVPVTGDEININGVTDYRGIVRDAKDPQRMYNYWVSAQTEMIALAPRAPFIAAEGQMEGHEHKWNTANIRNYPYLEYKPKTVSGQMSPPPQRQSWEPPIQAMTAAIMQSDQDLKATGGFHDASLGMRGPQESGKAIRSRQQQDEMSNSHYLDNLARAVRFLGRIIVDLVPKIYDTARVLRITGNDEQIRQVMVYSGEENRPEEGEAAQLPPGVEGIYDLGVGRYDVVVSVGPSFQTRRQDATDALTKFIQAYPAVFPQIGDLLAENMDWPGSKKVAARLRKMLPQNLQEDVDTSKMPPEVQSKLQQLEEQLKQVTEAYQQTKQALDTDQAKQDAQIQIKSRQIAADAASQERELQSKVQLEAIKQEGENARALAKIEQSRASEVLQAEVRRLDGLIERIRSESEDAEKRYERMATADSKPTTPAPPTGPPAMPQRAPAGGGMPPEGMPPAGGLPTPPEGVV
tara:strand:- start:2312 stop:4696 length:2385 start_codon:yes stop_codon:yes gene_type:complete